ncbi:four helix bundle protein [Thiohalocapsa marina]|uniref:Four helix bundle protein n=1 Tax=Thiohalocapsa marina TaxID=424902 RepID=A0A5M8FK14_9GAMM|nr:four helix bundle protein [Thiohalocapsa marina]KAA6185049.1 four helix bundle protein [Thiohalocapsa marina]
MATIQKFEDIEVWQKARALAMAIYALSNDGQFARDFGLHDQIRRASVSIMSNIAEGFGRGGNKEFLQFLLTAKGSASEVQAQLYIALDVYHIKNEQFQSLYVLAQSTGNMIGSLIRYLAKSDNKGIKYETRSNARTGL